MHPPIDEETRAFLLDDERLGRFVDRLKTGNRTRVRLPDLWLAFAAVYDDLPDGPQRRLWLLATLEQLSELGRISLPVRHGKQWDHTSKIALPSVISLPCGPTDSVVANWRHFPWHPKLQWVLQRRYVNPSDIEFLTRVNQGLVEGWFEENEPFKYRSLQLTGDEKRLTTLASSALFGAGKLTLEMLGCEPEVLPLAVARVSTEPTMLLFENAAPFMVARGVLSKTSPTRIGCLGYGAGKQLVKSVGYFSLVEPPVREILYVGDLDAEGIRLAAQVSRMSTHVPVRPATHFHLAMFASASALGFSDGLPVTDEHTRHLSPFTLEYLDVQVRGRASTLVRSGRRIPEEVISRSLMRRLIEDACGQSA
jgi:hypothetical protein